MTEPVHVTRPPKPVSEMTDEELDAYCDEIIEATQRRPS
jgi:hypothetical protein